MKYLLIILLLSSCGLVSPKTGCPGSERDVRRHDRKPFIVRQWVKKVPNGWKVVTIKSNQTRKDLILECEPDSTYLANL